MSNKQQFEIFFNKFKNGSNLTFSEEQLQMIKKDILNTFPTEEDKSFFESSEQTSEEDSSEEVRESLEAEESSEAEESLEESYHSFICEHGDLIKRKRSSDDVSMMWRKLTKDEKLKMLNALNGN